MTWMRYLNWRVALPYCRKAACWWKAHRRKSRAIPKCRKPISVECSNEFARSQWVEFVLRGFPYPVRRVAACGAQRGGGAARPQWRRQEHHAEKPDGRRHAALRLSDVRWRRYRRKEKPHDRPSRHAAGP